MSQPQSESRRAKPVPKGVPYPISRECVEEHWDAVECHLRIMESWTQCISAGEIRQNIASGEVRLWPVLDHTGRVALAITRINATARGLICIVWLVASSFADDASIFALIDECEADARCQGCVVFAINAVPFWADRLRGKMTAVIFERDLRISPRTN